MIANQDLGLVDAAGSELDNGKRAHASCDASRRYGMLRFQHSPVARHEQDVNRKSHEERVDEARRRENQSVFRRQAVPPEQAPIARLRIGREFEDRRHEQARTVIPQRERPRCLPQQRL